VDQDVEEDQRDPDVLLELATQGVGQAAMRPHDQAHEADALVVHLAQDTAGAAGLTLIDCPLVEGVEDLVAARAWQLRAARLRDGRRSHIAFLSFPEVGCILPEIGCASYSI
jgi:hypothetical protein